MEKIDQRRKIRRRSIGRRQYDHINWTMYNEPQQYLNSAALIERRENKGRRESDGKD